MKQAADPHHNGFGTWGWDGNHLYHRSGAHGKWTKVNRVHATKKRIACLHKLMNEVENE